MWFLLFLLAAAILFFTVDYSMVSRRRNKLLREAKSIQATQILVLETTLKATGKALDQQKSVSKSIFDLLLVQIAATDDLKEEKARLERELAMAEEQIHVLTPARDLYGRFTPTYYEREEKSPRLFCQV